MRKDEIYLPEDFTSIEGKLRVVEDSLDGLLAATEKMAEADDGDDTADAIIELMAEISASLITLHLVVSGLLEDQQQCT